MGMEGDYRKEHSKKKKPYSMFLVQTKYNWADEIDVESPNFTPAALQGRIMIAVGRCNQLDAVGCRWMWLDGVGLGSNQHCSEVVQMG